MLLGVLRRQKEDRAEIAEIGLHARLDFELMHEFGIHPRAGAGQILQYRRSFEGTIDQHSSGRVRGFAPRFSALDHQNGSAALPQGNRQGKPNDAAADDDYIPSLHCRIVKELAKQAWGRAITGR